MRLLLVTFLIPIGGCVTVNSPLFPSAPTPIVFGSADRACPQATPQVLPPPPDDFGPFTPRPTPVEAEPKRVPTPIESEPVPATPALRIPRLRPLPPAFRARRALAQERPKGVLLDVN